MKKKILHIIDSLGRAGAETIVVNTIKSLSSYHHLVVILKNINDFGNELPPQVRVICLEHNSHFNLPFSIIKLRRIINDYQPNIVHSQLFWSSLITRIATPKHIKLYYTNQSLQKYEVFSKWYYILAEKITYKKHHNLICVSKEVENEYKSFIGIKGNSYVLYNFVDDAWFDNAPQKMDFKNLNFISVGRSHPQKNYEYLIPNFPFENNLKLTIFGKDSNHVLENLIHKTNNPNILYSGISFNLLNEYKNFNIYISASRYEGLSLAVAEAMAQGFPVILSDMSVYREQADYAGIFFDINDPNSLKRIIYDILDKKIDLEYYSKMSIKRANEIAKREEYVQKLLKIYND